MRLPLPASHTFSSLWVESGGKCSLSARATCQAHVRELGSQGQQEEAALGSLSGSCSQEAPAPPFSLPRMPLSSPTPAASQPPIPLLTAPGSGPHSALPLLSSCPFQAFPLPKLPFLATLCSLICSPLSKFPFVPPQISALAGTTRLILHHTSWGRAKLEVHYKCRCAPAVTVSL